MPSLSITLQPEQEVALRRDYVFAGPPSQSTGRASRGCPVPMTGKRPDSL